ncbi:D-2-hydroxyacid dehydrogenase [Pedobacter metabolipauper]|uniref:Phosphoglycerate dehydrogenase-like enzyme n=1 Tax=Pedobacter metabolipauper TaxID=425513 RepID=A0A4R6T206_9SPHI|nr:D-2-hydroxyacid dehydrogenase [Pedobacter metabolipauper]TDQ11550.1 phosphoglycerate dehydrogenase-like enzyme [Pedobacter metabolipauper]
MRILVYSNLYNEQKQILKQELPEYTELIFKSDLSENELTDAVKSAEVLLGNPPADLLNGELPNLIFWQLDSAGFNQYEDVTLSIPVANMGDLFAVRCAETIVGGLISLCRGIHELVRLQDQKKWMGVQMRSGLQGLDDKKVMILGAGAIGLAVKKMLTGFGCQITLTARENRMADLHRFDDILAVLPETDVVINTLPGNANKYVSKVFIDAMKPGSIYGNIGRGNTTDEPALIHALESGKLGGAILDVTVVEPLPEDHKLWGLKNVILTQHTGGGGQDEENGKVSRFLINFRKLIENEPLNDLIDLKQGY